MHIKIYHWFWELKLLHARALNLAYSKVQTAIRALVVSGGFSSVSESDEKVVYMVHNFCQFVEPKTIGALYGEVEY